MPDPWFEFGKRADSDYPAEDVWFSANKARRLGFRMYCDLDASIGHLNTCAVWPSRDSTTQALDVQRVHPIHGSRTAGKGVTGEALTASMALSSRLRGAKLTR